MLDGFKFYEIDSRRIRNLIELQLFTYAELYRLWMVDAREIFCQSLPPDMSEEDKREKADAFMEQRELPIVKKLLLKIGERVDKHFESTSDFSDWLNDAGLEI